MFVFFLQESKASLSGVSGQAAHKHAVLVQSQGQGHAVTQALVAMVIHQM